LQTVSYCCAHSKFNLLGICGLNRQTWVDVLDQLDLFGNDLFFPPEQIGRTHQRWTLLHAVSKNKESIVNSILSVPSRRQWELLVLTVLTDPHTALVLCHFAEHFGCLTDIVVRDDWGVAHLDKSMYVFTWDVGASTTITDVRKNQKEFGRLLCATLLELIGSFIRVKPLVQVVIAYL
jgi:hypothetical protein